MDERWLKRNLKSIYKIKWHQLTRVSRHPSQKSSEEESKKREHRQRAVNQNHQKDRKTKIVHQWTEWRTSRGVEAAFFQRESMCLSMIDERQ